MQFFQVCYTDLSIGSLRTHIEAMTEQVVADFDRDGDVDTERLFAIFTLKQLLQERLNQ